MQKNYIINELAILIDYLIFTCYNLLGRLLDYQILPISITALLTKLFLVLRKGVNY